MLEEDGNVSHRPGPSNSVKAWKHKQAYNNILIAPYLTLIENR